MSVMPEVIAACRPGDLVCTAGPSRTSTGARPYLVPELPLRRGVMRVVVPFRAPALVICRHPDPYYDCYVFVLCAGRLGWLGPSGVDAERQADFRFEESGDET